MKLFLSKIFIQMYPRAFPVVASNVKAITIRLRPGQDLKAELDKLAVEQNIDAACILTCVGSLKQLAIRFANMPNTNIISQKFEILSLNGTLASTGSHIHIAVSDHDGKTIGRHLKEGSIIYTTAEIVLAIFAEVIYEREIDDTYGHKELVVKNGIDKK